MKLPRSTLPICITYGSGLCGLGALYVASHVAFPVEESLSYAGQLIMLAMILDGLDGNIARAIGATSRLGAQLDTFMDFLSFGIAPSFLYLAFGNPTALDFAAVVIFICSSAFRLARFRVLTETDDTAYFTGLPITITASWIALLALVPDWSRALVFDTMTRAACSAAIILLSALQVTSFQYPKPTQNWYIYGFASLIILGALLLKADIRIIPVLVVLFCGLIYCATPLMKTISKRMKGNR
jgi:CDP-diacylglycerol---serine O-phosphatidyltransferase